MCVILLLHGLQWCRDLSTICTKSFRPSIWYLQQRVCWYLAYTLYTWLCYLHKGTQTCTLYLHQSASSSRRISSAFLSQCCKDQSNEQDSRKNNTYNRYVACSCTLLGWCDRKPTSCHCRHHSLNVLIVIFAYRRWTMTGIVSLCQLANAVIELQLVVTKLLHVVRVVECRNVLMT